MIDSNGTTMCDRWLKITLTENTYRMKTGARQTKGKARINNWMKLDTELSDF